MGALTLADEARREVLRVTMRARWLRPVLLDRSRRLHLVTACSGVATLALALWQPVGALFISTALLGVPHLVATLRHTAVVRPASRVSTGLALLVLGLSGLTLAGLGVRGQLEAVLALTFLGPAWEARGRPMLLLAIVGGAALALQAPLIAVAVVAQGHALSSLLFAGVAARERHLRFWWPAIGFIVLSVLAVAGVLDPLLNDRPWVPPGAFESILSEVQSSAGGAGGHWLQRAVFIYALGQGLHLAVWLRVMPELDRPTPNPSPFRQQWSRLRADLGPALWPAVLGAVIVAPLLLVDGGVGRTAYFALSFFHVGFEASALMRLSTARPPQSCHACDTTQT
ncbi:MAG: hypothetical protein U0228_24305 [Myxococcaceae bacterium]